MVPCGRTIFANEEIDLPPIGQHDQLLVRNEYSPDAGFRKADERGDVRQLPAGNAFWQAKHRAGQVIESLNPRYPVGAWTATRRMGALRHCGRQT
jgi:hypothetical protein